MDEMGCAWGEAKRKRGCDGDCVAVLNEIRNDVMDPIV